jgi:hypothetical protein
MANDAPTVPSAWLGGILHSLGYLRYRQTSRAVEVWVQWDTHRRVQLRSGEYYSIAGAREVLRSALIPEKDIEMLLSHLERQQG